MFTRILVPIGACGDTARVLDVARQLATCLHTEVALVRAETDIASTQETDALLQRYVRDLAAQRIHAERILTFPPIEEGIIAVGRGHSGDVIVLAPHGRAYLDALRHPSALRHMIATAPMPTLIVPEGMVTSGCEGLLRERDAVIIVPLDGSVPARAALPFVVTLSQEYGRPPLLVSVVEPVAAPGSGSASQRRRRASQAERRHEAAHELATVRQRLAREASIAAQSVVVWGKPSEGIVRVAEAHPGGLIVMAASGYSLSTTDQLSDTTAAVLRQSPLPVLLIPTGATVTHSSTLEFARSGYAPTARPDTAPDLVTPSW